MTTDLANQCTGLRTSVHRTSDIHTCVRTGPGRASHIARPLIVSTVGGYPYTPGVTATRIGYARCSTDKQDLAAQRAALLDLGRPVRALPRGRRKLRRRTDTEAEAVVGGVTARRQRPGHGVARRRRAALPRPARPRRRRAVVDAGHEPRRGPPRPAGAAGPVPARPTPAVPAAGVGR